MSRELPYYDERGQIRFREVPAGEPPPYEARNESDEPVDDRLASAYHCRRWAKAASDWLDLAKAGDAMARVIRDLALHARYRPIGTDEVRALTEAAKAWDEAVDV